MNDSANVRITVDTKITNYQTRVLGSEEASFTPIILDPSIVITATGSQTEIGESANTYTIDWNNANENNYILKEDLGTLTVLPKSENITITAPVAKKVYDGTPLEASAEDVEVTGLPKGYKYKVAVAGTQTQAGESESRITSYKILDKNNVDVTDQFENIKVKKGTLTVDPLSVSISCGTGSAGYTGSMIVPEPVLTYVNGAHAGETVKASMLSASRIRNLVASAVPMARAPEQKYRFVLFTGDTIEMSITGMGTGAGTYTMKAEITLASENISCPSSSITGTTITINPVLITIRTGAASKF